MKSTLVMPRTTPVLAFTAMLLAAGCTHIYKQPIQEVALTPVDDKLDLPVRLEITDDFRNAKWEEKAMGSTITMPVGENLVHNTELLVRNVFRHPLIPSSDARAPSNAPETRYVLRPKVVFVEQTFGVSAFSKATTSIEIEWNLARGTGTPVWVETIRGVGVGKAGNLFTGEEYQKQRLKMALEDLFRKSQEAMLSSPVLRKLQ